jgi:tRNA1Val (adenine37-N6)-methyltransferase
MKVSTDACILGALTPVPVYGNILDIGSGTGLLALMLAQRCECEIDSVEMDMPSYFQAKSNCEQSEWSNRLHVIHSDIRTFFSEKKYDVIICNPPFFEHHLRSPSEAKNKAKHADNLPLETLIKVVKNFLCQHGIFSLLLPTSQLKRLAASAHEYGLYLQQEVTIRANPYKQFTRAIYIFYAIQKGHHTSSTLTIQDEAGNYTHDFLQLMRPYYLHL